MSDGTVRPRRHATTAALHLLVGVGLARAPRRALDRPFATATPTTSAVVLVRMLAARHAAEALWLARSDSGSTHLRAAGIEIVHLGSMALWRPSSPSLTTFARRSALLSSGFLVVHGVLAVRQAQASYARTRRRALPPG